MSRLPSSGVMNPYPLSSLNHFTTPVAIEPSSDDLSCCVRGGVAPVCNARTACAGSPRTDYGAQTTMRNACWHVEFASSAAWIRLHRPARGELVGGRGGDA